MNTLTDFSLLPGWTLQFDDGSVVPVVDKCRYNKQVIPGYEEKLDLYYRKPLDGYTTQRQRYAQPIAEQVEVAMRELIKKAQRTLREVPICNVTGQPVEIWPAHTANYSRIQLGYMCRHCHVVE